MIGVVPAGLTGRLSPDRWAASDGETLGPGVWGILPTPFADDLSVDLASVTSVVEAFVETGVTGLVSLGVFGEAARLTDDEQIEVLSAVAAAAGDVPVIAGVSPVEPAPSLAAARMLVQAVPSVAGLMVKVSSPDADETAAHLRDVAEATGRGIVVQDYPTESGVRIEIDELVRAVVASGVVLAVKAEAAPTSVAIARICAQVDVPVFGGLGGVGLIDELGAGAAGAMTGFSHPETLLAAIRSFDAGGFAQVRAAFTPWLPLVNFEGQPGIGLSIRKEILRRRGMISCAAVRPPAATFPPELSAPLDDHLAAIAAL